MGGGREGIERVRKRYALVFSPRVATDNLAGSVDPRVLEGEVLADEEADAIDCEEVEELDDASVDAVLQQQPA